MADLNIPNLNTKSDKYIFKKKLSLRRKSKRRLIIESAFMFISSLLIVYINILIPNKNLLLLNLPNSLNKFFVSIKSVFLNLYEIILVLFIFISLVTALILFVGSFYRLFKIMSRKTKKIIYK